MPTHLSLNLLPVLPSWLIVLVAIGLLYLLVHGSLVLRRVKLVPARWVGILALLRIVIVAVFILALLQPVASYTVNTQLKPDYLVMIDTSRSMGVPAAVGKGTRVDEALAAFRSGGPEAALAENFNLHWFAFDRTSRPLTPDDLAHLKPDGDTTRYAGSLTAALDYQREAGSGEGLQGLPQRALLISDGRDLGEQDVVEAARDHGIVIDTLAPTGASAADLPAHTTVASVQSPRRILLGSEARFVATLRHEGAAEPPLALSLVEGGKTIASQDVIFTAGAAERLVQIAYRPTEAGVKQYEIRLAPKAAAKVPAGEPWRFSVQVLDSKNEVLVLEDTWRWDFKYLRRVIEDDPSFSFTAMLARGPTSYLQLSKPDSRVHLGGFPQTRAELGWFDMIVLDDPNLRRWPKGLASALASLVKDEGRSLIVIAGPNLAQWIDTPELYPLLPVELAPESAEPMPGPIEFRLTPEGAASPFFFKAPKAAGVGGPNTPLVLPPVDQIYPPLRKRPAATVLVEASKQANTYGNLIVVAEHTVGRGRVLLMSTDTVWKWQTLGDANDEGLTPATIFWQQTLRAMAPPRPNPGGVSLTVQPDHSRFEAGQAVGLTAEVQSDHVLPAARLQATVVLPDDKQIPLNFAPDAAQPRLYRATFDTSQPGQYKINTALTAEGKTAADIVTAIDVDKPRAEMTDTSIDLANLDRIASMTGGKRIIATDRQSWPVVDNTKRLPVDQTRTIDLWNNFTMMLVLCTLFLADWGIRLLRGYM